MTESVQTMFVFLKEGDLTCPVLLFVTSADGPQRSLWWSPDRLFGVFTPEFICKQSGRSPVGAWWFLTSGQADVQRTWIKHAASSDHRLQAFRGSNETWGVISIHKKKKRNNKRSPFVRYLWCSIKYAWHLCSLTWVAKWLWQSKPRQVCQSGGWEGKWMDPSLPAGRIDRSFVWPARSVYQLMKRHVLWVEVEYSTCLFHTSCSLKFRALLFPPRRI